MTWLDRAALQYKNLESAGAAEDVLSLAWDAKQCFVEAQDMRKCSSYQVRRLDAGKMHRRGVKLFNQVQELRNK